MRPTPDPADQPPCSAPGCGREAAFWAFDPDGWRPLCRPHAEHRLPSIEVGAWLESGLYRPIELEKPEGTPEPPSGRGAVFYAEIVEAMGWSPGAGT